MPDLALFDAVRPPRVGALPPVRGEWLRPGTMMACTIVLGTSPDRAIGRL